MSVSYFAVFCEVDAAQEAVRLRVRGDHLAFLDARKAWIHFGGPLTSSSGVPETMLMVLKVENLDAALRFMDDEPYNRGGVFKSVAVRPWVQVLPESHPGAIAEAVAAERVKHASLLNNNT